MAKKQIDERFSFTWGLPILDRLGYVEIYKFMLATYSALGISRNEMLCLIHLASYKYNSPKGTSKPALTTIALEMGYSHKQRISELIRSLKEKKMLTVTYREGLPSIYDASPFARKALAYTLEHHADDLDPSVTPGRNTPSPSVTPGRNTPSPSVTPGRDPVLRQGVTKEPKEQKKQEKKKSISSSLQEKNNLWALTLQLLDGQMVRSTFDQWLRGTTVHQPDNPINGTITIIAKHQNALPWLDGKLRPTIERTLRHVAEDPNLQIEFITQEDPAHADVS